MGSQDELWGALQHVPFEGLDRVDKIFLVGWCWKKFPESGDVVAMWCRKDAYVMKLWRGFCKVKPETTVTTDADEDAATLSQIRQFFTAHQFSRFASWDDPSHRPHNMVGYRKAERAPDGEALGVKFYVLPEGWKEIAKGRDPKKAAKLAMDAGWIAEHDAGKLQKTTRLPGCVGTPKTYVISDSVLSE